jgi:hypothetical protein
MEDGVDLCDADERAGFSRWAGFSWSGAGIFQLRLFQEILVAKIFDLGRNWSGKSMIPSEIRGIGARNFVAT